MLHHHRFLLLYVRLVFHGVNLEVSIGADGIAVNAHILPSMPTSAGNGSFHHLMPAGVLRLHRCQRLPLPAAGAQRPGTRSAPASLAASQQNRPGRQEIDRHRHLASSNSPRCNIQNVQTGLLHIHTFSTMRVMYVVAVFLLSFVSWIFVSFCHSLALVRV